MKRSASELERLLEEAQARASAAEAMAAEEKARASAAEARAAEEKARASAAEARADAIVAEYGDDTTFGELLDSRLPDFADISPEKATSTLAVGRRKPKDVCYWPLEEPMADFRQSLISHRTAAAKKMIRPSIGGKLQASEESALVSHFAETAGKAVDLLCLQLGHRVWTKGSGDPDFSFRYKDKPDFFSSRKSSGKALLCGEAKRKVLTTRSGSDLVSRYRNGEGMVVKVVEQQTGYQVQYGTEFGFITNYMYTWLMKLDPEGVLWISNAFSCDETGAHSTLNALLFLVISAINADEAKNWRCPSLPLESEPLEVSIDNTSQDPARGYETASVQGGATQETGVHGTSTHGGSHDSGTMILDLQCTLQRHPDRITYQAVMYTEEFTPVIVKCYVNRDGRDLELCCFKKLLQLQGKYIPKYLGRGTANNMETSRRFALILSWVGEDLDGRESIVPASSWTEAREAVINMHRLGVVHGDLEFRNMSYDQSKRRIFFFDFGNSLVLEQVGCDAFAKACSLELEHFDNLIASVKSQHTTNPRVSYLCGFDGNTEVTAMYDRPRASSRLQVMHLGVSCRISLAVASHPLSTTFDLANAGIVAS